MTVTRYDTLIVGGGISGLALAFELKQRDAATRVAVVERGYTGMGASSRNVGRIRAMQLTPELVSLAVAAQRKHSRLSDQLTSNTLFWRAGYAWVLYDEAEVERMAALRPMFRAAGLREPTLRVGARAVVRAMPVFRGGERPAGAMIGHDAVGHHDAVLYAYRRACARRDVSVLEHTTVVGIVTDGDRVTGVETTEGTIDATTVVNATDGWSRDISKLAGVKVPNLPVRREVFVTEPVRPFMRPAVTFYRPVEGWFNQTLRGELVAGVTAAEEPHGLNHDSSFEFLTRTSETLLRKAPRLGHLRIIRQWAGVYDMTPDRLPLVGPVHAKPGFVQMNGYSGRGFALAPLLAELLATWLSTGERDPLLEPLDPDRFEGRPADDLRSTDYYAAYDGRGS